MVEKELLSQDYCPNKDGSIGAEGDQLSDLIPLPEASGLEDREQILGWTSRDCATSLCDDGMTDPLLAKHVICNPYAKEEDDDVPGPGEDPSPSQPALSTFLLHPVSDHVILNPANCAVNPRRAGQEHTGFTTKPVQPTHKLQQEVQHHGKARRSGFLSSWLKRRHPQTLCSDPAPDTHLSKSLPSLWKWTTPKKALSSAVAQQGTSKEQGPSPDPSKCNTSRVSDSSHASSPSDVKMLNQDAEQTLQPKSPCTLHYTDTVLQNQYFLEERAELSVGRTGAAQLWRGGHNSRPKGVSGQSSGHPGGGPSQKTSP